jgi:hypothetical protein
MDLAAGLECDRPVAVKFQLFDINRIVWLRARKSIWLPTNAANGQEPTAYNTSSTAL